MSKLRKPRRRSRPASHASAGRIRKLEALLKQKQAELENYRKQTERHLENAQKFGQSELLLEVVNILDNFELIKRASKSLKDKQRSELAGWLEGVFHIQSQIKNLLQANFVQEIPVRAGDDFDPSTMEAIKSSGQKQKVKRVVAKGYRLHEQVLRPAKVEVH